MSRLLQIHRDSRGNVRETYRASWFPDVPPVAQIVRSESLPGVLRGMHSHAKQHDIWQFSGGSAYVQMYDPETGGLTGGWHDAASTLVIPPGIAHGFYTRDGCVLTYYLTREYDGSDEFEFDALDPDYPGSKAWPVHVGGDYLRSERDRKAPSFLNWTVDWA